MMIPEEPAPDSVPEELPEAPAPPPQEEDPEMPPPIPEDSPVPAEPAPEEPVEQMEEPIEPVQHNEYATPSENAQVSPFQKENIYFYRMKKNLSLINLMNWKNFCLI